jgi:hypothetical protein
MGSQQLLLIVVGVVVIGIMVIVGIAMFRDQASATNRDALSADLQNAAVLAHQWRKRPTALGGGGNQTFLGFQLIRTQNDNGTFALRNVTNSSMEIEAVGTEVGFDNATPVKLVIRVAADSAVSYVNELN